jgi:hypothetical protein
MSLRMRFTIRRCLWGIADRVWPAPEELTRLANKYGSDKGNRAFGRHYYTRIYDQLFRPFRDRPIALLEIGLRHPFENRCSVAPSLHMWRDYFPYARLVGFDIEDFTSMSLFNCFIVQGDMSSREDLLKLASYGPFDIVIDDGSHVSTHQQIALASLFPHVSSGGFYIIEDMNWQPHDLQNVAVPKTRDLLRRGCFDSPAITPSEAGFLATNVRSIELFDTQDVYNQDKKDALGVIVKL